MRARIILMAAAGMPSKDIAHRPELLVQPVTKWLKHYGQAGLAGHDEQPRLPRPRDLRRSATTAHD